MTDDKIKVGTKLGFDLDNGFGNYEGTGTLSHYHEAAYDAYMTGFSFLYILKFKEGPFGVKPPSRYNNNNNSKSNNSNKAEEEKKSTEEARTHLA